MEVSLLMFISRDNWVTAQTVAGNSEEPITEGFLKEISLKEEESPTRASSNYKLIYAKKKESPDTVKRCSVRCHCVRAESWACNQRCCTVACTQTAYIIYTDSYRMKTSALWERYTQARPTHLRSLMLSWYKPESDARTRSHTHWISCECSRRHRTFLIVLLMGRCLGSPHLL